VSPSYDTREQYERWHIRTCARCGRQAGKAANWSDGPICRTCLDAATRTRGTCPRCRAERLLPGRDNAGTAICRDCAQITRDFFCDRCHFEGRLLPGRLCERCTLTDQLTIVLDDGTGHIYPPLESLFDQLRTMAKPRSGLKWIYGPWPRALLQDLCTGRLALTHDAFRAVPNVRAAAYLSDLLMQCGALPTVDRQILLFERWLVEHLAVVVDPAHAQVLARFASWHQLRKLRAGADKGPLGTSPGSEARNQLTQAGSFLTWLAGRGVLLATCRQGDVDAWHAGNYATRRRAHAFLRWAMTTGRMPGLTIPSRSTPNPAPMGEFHRIAALGRLVTDENLPLRSRVAGSLVLLFAQPVARIVRLTIDDVLHDGDHTALRLGDPPTPVPEPLASLLLAYVADRPNMATATNPDSRWLFPGRRAGQPMQPEGIRVLLRRLDVPAQRGRATAIRQLVLQMPAPVVAQALGYHHNSTTRIAAESGSPWSGYAAGDHSR
jgi:hypothetical protein